MSFHRIVLTLLCVITMLAQLVQAQIIVQDSDPPPSGGAPSKYHAARDLDGDGLFDVVRTITSADTIEVWRGHADDTFTLESVYYLDGASAIAISDLNADGLLDLVVGSKSDDSVYVGTGRGTFTFTFGSAIFVGLNPGILSISDTCGDLWPEILLSNDELTTQKIVLEVMVNPTVYTVTSETPITCPERLPPPCGDEPACNPATEFPGIQECLRAADCRRLKCHWAACVNCHDGNGCTRWERVVWVAQNLACAQVSLLETAGCLEAALP